MKDGKDVIMGCEWNNGNNLRGIEHCSMCIVCTLLCIQRMGNLNITGGIPMRMGAVLMLLLRWWLTEVIQQVDTILIGYLR